MQTGLQSQQSHTCFLVAIPTSEEVQKKKPPGLCLDCNRCGRPGDKRLVMELMQGDLKALTASIKRDLPNSDFLID
jgi:hypothetical protein